MGTVYILGAGFSKTCGIATDLEMLDSLIPMLAEVPGKNGEDPRKMIESLREQIFHNQLKVGFEEFMSTLSSLKFFPKFLKINGNIFEEQEKRIQDALCEYLEFCVRKVDWENEGETILDFVKRVDWSQDFILTFNYDLLLEKAAKRLNRSVEKRIMHLHGVIGGTLAWPIYPKFAHTATQVSLAPMWKNAFNILFHKPDMMSKVVFIGYSMPPTDLEAKSLFNYTDWYNYASGDRGYKKKIVPAEKWYSYEIIVVNPDEKIKPRYGFLRKNPKFYPQTLEQWLRNPA